MQEATSDLNVTVIVVIIIALLLAFFFSFLWPTMRQGFRVEAKCNEAICTCPSRDSEGNCTIPEGGKVECYVKGNPSQKITCAWKG